MKRPGQACSGSLLDRLKFAAIGAALGAVVGVLLGFMLGFREAVGLWWTVPVTAAAGALVGFVFREGVGDFLGDLVAGIYGVETGDLDHWTMPAWLAVVLAVVACAVFWWVLR
jgi:hypothetical protein